MQGHWWTVWPVARDRLWPVPLPPARPWSTVLDDPRRGPIRLTGSLVPASGARRLLVLVHGLAGHADSGYCRRLAQLAAAAGWSSLRLNLRGADRLGADFYHAGLIADLEATLASPEVRAADEVALLGFSLGGHVVLRLAALSPGRVARVAAVCPPLDLAVGARHIDRARSLPYRQHLLRGLKEMYGEVARRGPVPEPPAALARVARIEEWDDRTVAPRFGFAGAADYYRQMSASAILGDVAIPALVVIAEHDPMVEAAPVRRALAAASAHVTARVLPRGGHVGFPGEAAIYRDVLAWLAGPSGYGYASGTFT